MPTEEGRGTRILNYLKIQLENSEMEINAKSIFLFLFFLAEKKIKMKKRVKIIICTQG